MKVVVVGCTHAGTAAVVNIKENYPDSEVVIYEKNNNVSFLSCGIALNVGKVIDTTEKLFYSSPEALNSLGAQTKMQHEVLDIDFKNKKLSVKNLLTNEVFEDNYDKLVLTLGSWPIVPKFEGGTLDNIVLCKNYNHALNIIEKSKERVKDIEFDKDAINICSVGKIIEKKGYYRLAQIHKRLINEGFKHNIYIIGIGEDEEKIRKYLKENNLEESYHLIGFRENPYKYVEKCDLFVCSSLREGFSTAVTEALVVGTPVVSTLCSGAQELLGYNNEYGLVVENSEEGIYEGIKNLLEDKELLAYYKEKAIERGSFFSKEKTVKAVENMIDSL